MQETVVGVQGPVAVDAPCTLYLHAPVLDLARVDVPPGHGLYEVVALYIKDVRAIADVAQPVPPRQLVVPKALSPQGVVVGGAIHIHLACGGVAETLAYRGFQFARLQGAPYYSRLGHPFAARRGVVVIAQTCIDGEPLRDVLTEIHVACHLVFLRIGTLHEALLGGHRLACRAVSIPCMAIDMLIVEACGDAVPLHQLYTLVPRHPRYGILRAEQVRLRRAAICVIAVVDLVPAEVVIYAQAATGAAIVVLYGKACRTACNPLVVLQLWLRHRSWVGGVPMRHVEVSGNAPVL